MPAELPKDGLVAVVKRDCPTCVMTAPVLGELARRAGIVVYSQDDPGFPDTVPLRESDLGLDVSHRLAIEIVPTLIRFERGREVARTFGWDRGEWQRVAGLDDLGHDLPVSQPGCGAKNIEPGIFERKYYAKDIGVFLEIESEGDVIQLVDCNVDPKCPHP